MTGKGEKYTKNRAHKEQST
uniref:Uncharacterized protein n=1 Tax=Arundo donax TaxID=35708 RepID=A0A0A9B0X8_ARUDO